MAEKSYRIRTEVGRDKVIKASLTQDIEFLEVLSLKINQEDTYKLHVSNYGIIVGRVLGNEAFGIPNAKVSVFIKLSDEDNERSEIVNLYPYRTIMTKDKENRRYNLLADSANDDCHRIVGTFPNKRLVLDNETEIEIYEKYWKYTTVTNQSGDFMIFGVPTGNHMIHVDIDLSDIGILSQKPRDFFYKGYNKEQFDSSEQFREGADLENLTQLLSQDTSVFVYPFFGDSNINDVAITRCDVQVPYKFEPTCVFFGSIVSDRKGENINHKCSPSRWIGYNRNMVTGEGTIEMIRKTPDGLVEEFPIKGNHLIDGDGVWCYQIPMNLDYIGTDEFGNIVPVQDTKKGIPTRTSVRFRISMQETETQNSTQHVAKYLVPNIHELNPESNAPQILNGSTYQNCYEFGSATPNEFFRDLLWNKVYSVKNYIPRFEHRNNWFQRVFSPGERGYSGIRSVSSPHNNNIFPFNSARFHIRFTYRIVCILMYVVVKIISFYNKLISEVICWELSFKVLGVRVNLGRPFSFLSNLIKCIGLKGEMFFAEYADTYFFPSCKDCANITNNEGLKVDSDTDKLIDIIQQTLALEYEIVNLDFYNDWINGALYMPLWFWKKKPKKKYLFGLITRKAVNTFCSCDTKYERLALAHPFQTNYDANFMPLNAKDEDIERHNEFDKRTLNYGVIKEFTNRAGLNVYYYAPGVPHDLNYSTQNGVTNYTQLFATDIILLGSLNSCDLDNLPKVFNALPSTTANLPFIATLGDDESGDGVVTGLDWGHDGNTTEGLLIDLTCWEIATVFKSGVNLRRLSELYVSLDMDISSNDETTASIQHDGVIGDKELVDNETRAKFASMNHNGLSNLMKNPTTNYDTYKFHYIYPVGFDGHLNGLSTTNGASLSMFEALGNIFKKNSNSTTATIMDARDSNYVMYRLGEGKDSKNKIRHKKHFYDGSENNFSFPLYNNSFYFYFGLNEGKTAIDKFNSMFNSSCVNRNKFGFTIDYVSKPGKWCYNTANTQTDFGTIDIEFEGLTDTFSYNLYNEFNELIIGETDVQSPDLRFGYAIKEGGGAYYITDDGYVKDGRICNFKNGEFIKNIFDEYVYLENGVYYLEIINSFGLKVTQKINMIQNILSPNIEEIKLGTKFNSNRNQACDICGEMDYYGEIRVKSFIIDGEEAFITNVDIYFVDGKKEDGYQEPKEVTCKAYCTDGSEVYLILEPEGDETQNISNFVCYNEGNVPSISLEMVGENMYTLIFNIWRPGDYVLTSNQICNNVMNDNMSVNTISIENGENFQVFLNGVPLSLINNDNFKGGGEEVNVALPNEYLKQDSFPRVWLQLENPQIYNFPSTLLENSYHWEDVLDLKIIDEVDLSGNTQTYISEKSKIDILKVQLDIIAKMRDMAYIYGDSETPQITITTEGGKEPILIRNIHPNYVKLTENNEICNSVVVDNGNIIEAPARYPHIIDKRYQKREWWVHNKPEIYHLRLNDMIYSRVMTPYNDADNNEKFMLGNYIAAFTNNGGMISLKNGSVKYDTNLYTETMPMGANPLFGVSINASLERNEYPLIIKDNYFRTLFVDKRIFSSGEIWCPVVCNYEINGLSNTEWQLGRYPVTLFNAAPLIYDDNYNIIGNDLTYCIKKKGAPSGTTMAYSYANNVFTMGVTNQYFKGSLMGQFTAETNDYSTACSILTSKLLSLYDNIITDVTISADTTSSDIKWQITYFDLEEVTNLDELKEDINLKLTSNLMWYSDLGKIQDNKAMSRNKMKLYKCLLDIDGVESDERSSFYFNMFGSEKSYDGSVVETMSVGKPHKEGGLPLMIGNNLSFTVANVKMKGDLSYNITKSNDEEICSFASYIEGAEEQTTKYNIGERVNIKSAAVSYNVQNSGEYIVWNNEKIYFNTQNDKKEKFYFYNKSVINVYNATTDNLTNYYIEKDGKTIKGSQVDTLPLVKFGDLNGYMWVKREYLNLYFNNVNVDERIKTFEEFIASNANLTMQGILNRYGLQHYTCVWGNNLYFTYNPYESENVITINETNFKGLGGIKINNTQIYDYYYSVPTSGYSNIHIITRDEYQNAIRNSNNSKICSEKNGYFYVVNETITQQQLELPVLCTINYQIEGNSKVISSFTYNQINEYGVSQNNDKEGIYLVAFLYLEDGNDRVYNPDYIISFDNNLTDGGDITINGNDYTIEKNPFNNKWYWRKNTEYKPFYSFYVKYEQSNVYQDEEGYKHYFYEGNILNYEDLTNDEKIKWVWNFEPYQYQTVIQIQESKTIDDSVELDKLKNYPHVSYDNGEVKCWHKAVFSYTTNDETRSLSIDGKEYKIYNSLYNKFEVQNISDFSCTINRDDSNDDFDLIEANPPFLSCAIVRNYGFNDTTKSTSALDGESLALPLWKTKSSEKRIINTCPSTYERGCFMRNYNWGLYNNIYYSTEKRWAKHADNGIMYEKGTTQYITFEGNQLYYKIVDLSTIKNNPITLSGENINWETMYGDGIDNHWTSVISWQLISSGSFFIKSNVSNHVYVFAPGTISADVNGNNITFTKLNSSFNIIVKNNEGVVVKNETLTYDDLKRRATNLMNKIEWVQCSNYKDYNEYYTDWRGLYGHRSMQDIGYNFKVNEISLRRLGNSYYFNGINKITNYFEINKRPGIAYYGTANMLQINGGITNTYDMDLDKKYRTVSPVIGEIYPYINRYSFGTIEDDKYILNDGKEYSLGEGKLGKCYGDYLQLPIRHPLRDDFYNYLTESGTYTQFYTNTSIKQERGGVVIFEPHIKEYSENSVEIVEQNEYYDELLYVYQPNTRETIIKGTEIISCNFMRTYYDENEDYRFKVVPMFNQSCNFHVGSIYVGNKVIGKKGEETKNYLPLYFPQLSNQDIKNAINGDIKFYFNNTKTNLQKNINEIKLFDGVGKIYVNIPNSQDDKPIGTYSNVNHIMNLVNNGYGSECDSYGIQGEEKYYVASQSFESDIKYDSHDSFYNTLLIYKKDNVNLDDSVDKTYNFTFHCYYGTNQDIPANGTRFTAHTRSNSAESPSFMIYNRISEKFFGRLSSETIIKDAQFVISNAENGTVKYNFSNVNDEGMSLVNMVEQFITHNGSNYSIVDNKVTVGGVDFEVINDGVILKYFNIKQFANQSQDGMKIYYDDVMTQITIKQNQQTLRYDIKENEYGNKNVEIPHFFNFGYKNGSYMFLDTEKKEIYFENNVTYNCGDETSIAIYCILKNKTASSEAQVVVIEEKPDKPGIQEGNVVIVGDKKYEITEGQWTAVGSSTPSTKKIITINGVNYWVYQLTFNRGKDIIPLVDEAITVQISNPYDTNFKNNTAYKQFSNIWKNMYSGQDLYKFNENSLKTLSELYNNPQTKSGDFFVEMLQIMSDYYYDSIKQSKRVVNLENFNSVWNEINGNKQDIIDSNFVITVKLKNGFVTLPNDTTLYFANDDGTISINTTKYTIKNSASVPYIQYGSSKIYVNEYILITQIECVEDYGINNDDLMVDLKDFYSQKRINLKNGLDLYKFLDATYIIRYNDNGLKKYVLHSNPQASLSTKPEIIQRFITDLKNSSSNNPIYLDDQRLHNYLVQVEEVSSDKKYFTYQHPFDETKKLKYDLSLGSYFSSYNKTNFYEKIRNLNRNNVASGDLVTISTKIVTFEATRMIEIECVDGFSFVGLEIEELTVINTQGEENKYTFDELYNNGALGQFIYHIKEVDGVYYNFVSQIKNMKEINSKYLIEIPDTLVNGRQYVLSIEANNIIHKMNYIYDNTNNKDYLKPL